MNSIPEDFIAFETNSPFILNVGPLYSRVRDDCVDMGVLVGEVHCNSRGRLHGAMVCAIADIALGQNVGRALAANGAFTDDQGKTLPGVGMATVNMSTDFAGTAKIGDWVEAQVEVQRAGKRMAFANAYLVCDGDRIARVSGIYTVITA